MAGRYFEELADGFALNVTDGVWWIEFPDCTFNGYEVYAVSDDGRRWDIVLEEVGHGFRSWSERVDGIVSSDMDGYSDVIDLLDLWQDLCFDRGFMVGNELAASKVAELLDGGNCYETAWDNMMDSIEDYSSVEPSLYVCHGICVYEGDTEFTHAWNETLDGEYVIDTSNGNDLFMPRWRYYEIFDVEPETVRRYKYLDGYAEMERTMKWGPWAPELQFVKRPKVAFDIPDENEGGDCFVVALENMMRDKDLYLCHGIVTGQGRLYGIRFSHAWNETQSGYVIDQSNGNDVCMPKSEYYALGNIDPSEVRYYDYEEMARNALEYGTYGPWDDELFGGVL